MGSAAPPMPLLSVEHVTMRFGGLTAIDDVGFAAFRGDITALIGPNGAGKTTLFNCITGFYKPDAGRITLSQGAASPDDLDRLTHSGLRHKIFSSGGLYLLERMSDAEIARRAKVARTFQNIRLFSGMTALENLIVARHNFLMAASGYTILSLLGLGTYRQAETESIEIAKYWLDKIGLFERADDAAGSLSYGGQRQLEIARAMMTQPLLLCLDEPAAGLNGAESAKLNALLMCIRDEHKTSVLLIEHDMSVVMSISDHIIVLDYGRKIADGAPAAIRCDEAVIAAYLGVEDKELHKPETALGV
jgi:branched-chain amino acid transport system ATP-binding protein